MPCRFCCCLLLIAGFLSISQASVAKVQFYSTLSIDGYSDAFPMQDLAKGLGQDFEAGKTHFALGRMENGVRYQHFSVAALYRYEAFVQSSKAASELIWRNETDREIPADKQWPLSLKVNQVSMYGMALSYRFDITPAFKLTGSLQLLRASEMYDGEIHGFIETYDDEYQGKLHLDYFYTRDVVWDRPTQHRYGEGAALDFQLDWALNRQHNLQLVMLDVVNGIYWKDMYYTTADMTSNRISYDEDGKLNVRAAMIGYEGVKDYKQRLPIKMTLRWAMQITDNHALDTEWVRVDEHDDLRWHYYPALLRGVYFSATARGALGIAFQSKYVHLGLRMDDVNYKNAQSLALWFNWQLGNAK